MENYFSLRVIEAVMHQKAPDGLTVLTPDVKVADQLGFDVKRNAGAIATAMSLDEIAGTDLLDFLQQVGSALG